jgi:HEAT repeat protein
VKAFGHFDGKKVRQALENALVDGSWQVRAEAAGSLEKLHDPLAAEVLFQSMLDPDEFVRLKTRRALGAVISDSNVAVYRRALRHSNRTVRTAAALGLASRRDDSATSVLFEALLDLDSSIRVSAARALASSGDRSARPLLRESLSDSNANVRATAALALAELGDVVSTNRLAFLMQRDPAEGVRLAAAQACQVLSPPRALVQIAPPQ